LNLRSGSSMNLKVNENSSAITALHITNAGNVGIRTSSPTQKLEISGTGDSFIRATQTDSGQKSGINLGQGSNTHWELYKDNGASDNFYIRHGGSSIAMSILASNRNVGIGTAAPSCKLDVVSGDNGLIADFSGVGNPYVKIVAGSNAADYQTTNTDAVLSLGTVKTSGYWESIHAAGGARFCANGGNLKIGAGASASYNINVKSSGHAQILLDSSSTSSASWVVHQQGTTANRGWLSGMEGNLTTYYLYDLNDNSYAVHVPASGTAWAANSDERMKKDITSMENRLDDLLNIKVRRFKWKKNDRVADGFIAQELVTCVPEAVEVGEDGVWSMEEAEDSETRTEGELKNPWSVSRELLIPMMVKSIQELSAKVTALENA
jgi:hypothetical protein